MITRRSAHLGLLAVLTLGACGTDDAPADDPTEEFAGGDLTAFDKSRDAFARPATNLLEEHRTKHFAGNALFNRNWVTAPASTTGIDGLGPTFNARSCSACHFKDGRGKPPEGDEVFLGLLLRLSVPGEDAHGGPLDEPSYGGQFNHLAILGVPSEGESHVTYEEQPGTFADGTPYGLLAPRYTFDALAFGPMADDVMISPRVAPTVVGLGLLEAIAEADILANEDPDDQDGDGISGRANRVWHETTQRTVLGRFGWKANQPDLEQQNAGAFHGDLGITSPIFAAQNCPMPQRECQGARDGGMPELEQNGLDNVTLYTRTLAVPARRGLKKADVRAGKALFTRLACVGCHVDTFETGDDAKLDELKHQTFHPYTDLLLHDMGEGLSDGRPDFLASGSEWRTPPLWGLGLIATVNRHTRFLHDGRARDVNEAILWHGGEAEAAREAYRALDAEARAHLLAFLDSL